MRAYVCRKCSIRNAYFRLSTLTPIQMFGIHSSNSFKTCSRSERFVRIWNW